MEKRLKYYKSLRRIRQQGLINYHLRRLIVHFNLKDQTEPDLETCILILKAKSVIVFELK